MNKPGQTYVRSNLQSRNPHEMFFLFLLVHEHTFIAVPYSDQKGANISWSWSYRRFELPIVSAGNGTQITWVISQRA